MPSRFGVCIKAIASPTTATIVNKKARMYAKEEKTSQNLVLLSLTMFFIVYWEVKSLSLPRDVDDVGAKMVEQCVDA